MSKQSKEMKEQKKNKGSVLVAESAYNSQNAQFDLVISYLLTTSIVPNFTSAMSVKKSPHWFIVFFCVLIGSTVQPPPPPPQLIYGVENIDFSGNNFEYTLDLSQTKFI